MKKLLILISILTFITRAEAQDKTFNLYEPNADATLQIKNAVEQANKSNKHILIQLGGNWCKWCRYFHQFSTTNFKVDSILKADYVVAHINYSKENKNEAVLKQLEYPQRFGFPVFVVLNGDGKRIHTQNSAYLESGEGYGEEKVVEFLMHWNKAALSEKNY